MGQYPPWAQVIPGEAVSGDTANSDYVDDWMIHIAVQNYLLHERGAERRKVCCISMDYHPSFSWYEPQVPHFYWDPDAVMRCAVVWLKKVGRGNHIIQQKLIKAEFRGSLAS